MRKDADFSVKRLSGGGLYDSLKDTRSIAMFRAYEIAASKNGQPSDEPLECSAPLPRPLVAVKDRRGENR